MELVGNVKRTLSTVSHTQKNLKFHSGKKPSTP